jgi:hypothetical protein
MAKRGCLMSAKAEYQVSLIGECRWTVHAQSQYEVDVCIYEYDENEWLVCGLPPGGQLAVLWDVSIHRYFSQAKMEAERLVNSGY